MESDEAKIKRLEEEKARLRHGLDLLFPLARKYAEGKEEWHPEGITRIYDAAIA